MSQRRTRRFRSFLVACTLALGAGVSPAQDYPSRPITLVVPYGPGGNADLAARSLAAAVQSRLKQPLVVVNRAGAGGIVGSRSVVDSAKDGYTLLVARVGSQAVAPALDPAATYTWDSFTMLSLLEIDPYVCVVPSTSSIRTFDQLVQTIRQRPGKLSYASTGNLDASVVFPIKMLLNAGMAGDAALKVPYKSSPETVTALLSGQTEFACNGLSPYMGHLKAGTLRGIVVSTKERVTQLPDVPTVAEVGMPNLQFVSGWSALYGPPGLPREVIKRWSDALAELKNDAEWMQQVRTRGSVPTITTPEETRKFAEEQYNAYKALASALK